MNEWNFWRKKLSTWDIWHKKCVLWYWVSLSETKGYFLILNNVQVGYDTREYQSPNLHNTLISWYSTLKEHNWTGFGILNSNWDFASPKCKHSKDKIVVHMKQNMTFLSFTNLNCFTEQCMLLIITRLKPLLLAAK